MKEKEEKNKNKEGKESRCVRNGNKRQTNKQNKLGYYSTRGFPPHAFSGFRVFKTRLLQIIASWL